MATGILTRTVQQTPVNEPAIRGDEDPGPGSINIVDYGYKLGLKHGLYDGLNRALNALEDLEDAHRARMIIIRLLDEVGK